MNRKNTFVKEFRSEVSLEEGEISEPSRSILVFIIFYRKIKGQE
jgi:hypothetical protein